MRPNGFSVREKVVKDAFTIWYHLGVIEIRVTKLSNIYVGNMDVVINAADPTITLNKMTVALAYHFIRDHVANGAVAIKIGSNKNYANP
eukprot:12209766-Ditylum_brightwellii.AAC.1